MRLLAESHLDAPDHPTDRVATTFAAHHAFVRERLRGLGVAAADLDDATQDVFVVLVRRIADYDAERPIRHWLAGMARRVARRYRERSRRSVVPFDPTRAVAHTDPDDALRRAEAQDVLEAFLRGLDADRWAVFVLGEIEGLRGTEIAAELELNLNTVYARLRSARHELDRALRRHHARERRGWAALLPFGLGGGRRGMVSAAAAGVLVVLAATAITTRQGCARGDEGSENAARAIAASDASAPSEHRSPSHPPVVDGGLSSVPPRAADPALPSSTPTALAARLPDEDGWFAAGSGLTSSRDRTLSHESRYRFEGDRVRYEITHVGDDDVPTTAIGYFQPEGLELVEGALDFELALGPEDTSVQASIFRATTEGCIELQVASGPRPSPGETSYGGRRTHRFVLEEGVLRHPAHDRECTPIAHPTEEELSGVEIQADVFNDCDVPAEFTVFATPHGKQAPLSLPRHRLEPGEHQRMRIDRAQWIRTAAGAMRLDADGEVHFYGEGCMGIRGRDG